VLGPFVPLSAKLGRVAMELAQGRADCVVVSCHGPLADFDTRLLTVAALNGAFQGRVDHPVNYVNAPLVADERGIEVTEEKQRAKALMALSIYTPAPPELVDAFHASGFDEAWFISLG